jgi:formylglycine-generating enzyme required for sulfatase activity/serine/threonine protein kinase
MLEPGTILQNRYRIIKPLGQGGMGAVYQAVDQRLRSTVALKETLVTGEQFRKAFEREACLLAMLRHAALPVVSDHFVERDGQFLVMQYIPGEDLGRLLQKQGKPFPTAVVLRWADQLLDALDYLHTRTPPVIHRDIKPQNLKLTDRGEIILLDFGLAKGAPSTTQRTALSAGSSILGFTMHYAPLEQMEGSGTDARSDIYSVAATLYHLITNVKPADALARAMALVSGRRDPLRPANEENPLVSHSVAAILRASMAQNKDDRPPVAAEVRRALREARRSMGGSSSDTSFAARPFAPPQPEAPPPTPSGPLARPVAPRAPDRTRHSGTLAVDGDRPMSWAPREPAREGVGTRYGTGPLSDAPPLHPGARSAPEATVFRDLIRGPAPAWRDLAATLAASSLPIRAYEFTVVTLDPTGREVERVRRGATGFPQNLGGVLALDLMLVPEGVFSMGSADAPGREIREGPQHEARVAPFFLGRFPVTQAQWRLVASLPRVQVDLAPDPSFFKGDDRPVEKVSWIDCVEFCARLTRKAGRPYRLPSEAEWEYACRAGTTTAFHVGETITTNVANYDGTFAYGQGPSGVYRRETTPVGSFGVANLLGLEDVHGNVWEWCFDVWHETYEGAPADGSAWVAGGNADLRVLRGGSWYGRPDYCRSTARVSLGSDGRNGRSGFRVAMSLPEQ